MNNTQVPKSMSRVARAVLRSNAGCALIIAGLLASLAMLAVEMFPAGGRWVWLHAGVTPAWWLWSTHVAGLSLAGWAGVAGTFLVAVGLLAHGGGRAMSDRLKALLCRLIGHSPYQSVLWVAGQPCTSPAQCVRCYVLLGDQAKGGTRG